MAFVASKHSSGSFFTDKTETITLDTASTPGNSLIVLARMLSGSAEIASVTDSVGSSYQTAITSYVGAYRGGIFYSKPNSSVTSVTVTSDVTSTFGVYISILEFSDLDGALTGTPVSANTTASTTHNSGTVTPVTSDNVMTGFIIGSGGTYTNDADFTIVPSSTASQSISFGVYRIQSSATAQELNITSVDNGDSTVVLAAFAGGYSNILGVSTLSGFIPTIDLVQAGLFSVTSIPGASSFEGFAPTIERFLYNSKLGTVGFQGLIPEVTYGIWAPKRRKVTIWS